MAAATGQQRDTWLLGQRELISGEVGRRSLTDKVHPCMEGTELLVTVSFRDNGHGRGGQMYPSSTGGSP